MKHLSKPMLAGAGLLAMSFAASAQVPTLPAPIGDLIGDVELPELGGADAITGSAVFSGAGFVPNLGGLEVAGELAPGELGPPGTGDLPGLGDLPAPPAVPEPGDDPVATLTGLVEDLAPGDSIGGTFGVDGASLTVNVMPAELDPAALDPTAFDPSEIELSADGSSTLSASVPDAPGAPELPSLPEVPELPDPGSLPELPAP